MPTPEENLLARRAAVCAELAAMTSTSAGGQPTYNADGQLVQHNDYRRSLYEELKQIDDLLADDVYDITSEIE